MASTQEIEKVTFNIPSSLKKKATLLKDELNISMSTLYKEAIEAYVHEKEILKWQKAAEIMSNEYEKDSELKVWLEFEEDIHDYTSK